MNIMVTVILIVTCALGTIPKGLIKDTERLGNQRTRGDHPDYSIIKIGLNTEKSPGDVRALALHSLQ